MKNDMHMTFEQYKDCQTEWNKRLYRIMIWRSSQKGVGKNWLLLHKSTVSLPDYIRGRAKKTLIPAKDGMSPHLWHKVRIDDYFMRLVECRRVIYTDWGILNSYVFMDDDPNSEPIDLKNFPLNWPEG